MYARYVAEVKASNARLEARELWARSQFPELANPFHRHHPRAKDPKKIAGNLHWWTMNETGWNVLMDSLNPD